jgi:hypothetical protein
MGGNSIGRITTGGVVTNYTGTGITGPWGITSGPNGALWFANYGNSTIGRITTPPPATTATAVTTSLSGGGQSGTPFQVLSGTAVTDTASLSGTNASTATGTVTYDVYSDSACTVAAPGGAGKPETITTPGTLPASSPVTLSTPVPTTGRRPTPVTRITRRPLARAGPPVRWRRSPRATTPSATAATPTTASQQTGMRIP